MAYGLHRIKGKRCRKNNGQFARCRGKLSRRPRRRR